MSILREQIRDWIHFWGEVVTMWRKEHGLNISLLWKLSPWITLISIVGIIALGEPWKTVAWVFFGIGIFDLLFSLCFVFPYKKWKQDTGKMTHAYMIELGQMKNPTKFISLEPDTIFVEGDENNRQIIVLDVKVRSLLLKPIIINKVAGELSIPLAEGKYTQAIVRFQSRALSSLVLSGVAGGIRETAKELQLDCQDNKAIPRTILINRWLYIEGQAIIESDIFPNITLGFAGSAYLRGKDTT